MQFVGDIKKLIRLNVDAIREGIVRRYGRSERIYEHIHHVSSVSLNHFYCTYSPCFVLSTGRSGTAFLTKLFQLSQSIDAFHEPQPCLQHMADFAYRAHGDRLLDPIFRAARVERMLESYIKGKTYVESNQVMTFFAQAIWRTFPNARFIHVVKHPGNFAVSAARKGWYQNDSIWEAGRPAPDADMSLIERLAWLWEETNAVIEELTQELSDERFIFARIEDITTNVDEAKRVLGFCGASVSERSTAQMLGNKVNQLAVGRKEPDNMRKDPKYPAYDQWAKREKEKLVAITGNRAAKYGYELDV